MITNVNFFHNNTQKILEDFNKLIASEEKTQ